MKDTEKNILTQLLSEAEAFRAQHGEGSTLSVLAIYMACQEAVLAKIAAQGAA